MRKLGRCKARARAPRVCLGEGGGLPTNSKRTSNTGFGVLLIEGK